MFRGRRVIRLKAPINFTRFRMESVAVIEISEELNLPSNNKPSVGNKVVNRPNMVGNRPDPIGMLTPVFKAVLGTE